MKLAVVTADVDLIDDPQILSFAAFRDSRHSEPAITPPQRARAELRNRCCPICNRATVEPVELRNGRLGRNGRMVPGTGTLVGFSCQACGHEWPVG